MPEMKQARVLLEVSVGIIPGTPMPEHTRQWAITSDEWNDATAEGRDVILAEANGKMQGYAALMMLQPSRFNWVKTEWIWL
jgi:hypothetical protein